MMKVSSSEKISIILALVFSLIAGTDLLIYKNHPESNFILYIIFSILFCFIVFYVSIFYAINNYIIRKIKPLFDTIDTLQMPVENLYKGIEDGSLLNDIDNRVMEWAKTKINEIDVLKANEKYRKEFLGNVSHELKTPLFNIQGYISTLIDGGIDDDAINMKYLKRTDKNINRLISIVKDLETITRLETGERFLEYTSFDIVQLISEVFEMHEIRAKRKEIDLRFDKPNYTKLMVRADKKGILDVLANLVINSIIYGREGGYVKASINETPQKVLISIEDNGIGIEEKYLKRVFERFFRIDKSRSKIQGGTGLGLAIVKHTIEAHRQSIQVESKPNTGTKFTFSLDKA
jgi:two-component system, OmpR family, phosphate regulon sensor histidine kinase PhoR